MSVHPIESLVAQAQSGYRRRVLLRRGLEGLLWGAAAALFLTLSVKALGVSRAWDAPHVKVLLFLLGAAIGAFPTGLAIPSRYELAKRLDDHFRFGDRLSSAYALRGRTEEGPLVALVLEEAERIAGEVRVSAALPQPPWGRAALSLLLLAISLRLPADLYPAPKPVVLEEETRKELQVQVKNLDELLKLEGEDLTEEEKKHFERIRQMIEQLQLEDSRISRKEMLARFAREIEGLEEAEGSSEALRRALEQLKEAKDAIAGRMLLNRQIEEIEKQQTELAVVDEKTGKKLRAEEIQVMIVQEERRKKQEDLARDIRKAAAEEGQDESSAAWEVELEGGAPAPAGEAEAGQATGAKVRVIATYEDLVKAAEKTDIRKMILAASADLDRASPAYREVYANYLRAFTHLLYQGQLSLGTRDYLRRYFRAIRPRAAAPKEATP
ncbi:MAG: hypothetical protein HYU36_23640 [Planctomycetes bacterium]|nr:hypothetical protein [Planctomycetota bacterium]